jgi:hypothetical protein
MGVEAGHRSPEYVSNGRQLVIREEELITPTRRKEHDGING